MAIPKNINELREGLTEVERAAHTVCRMIEEIGAFQESEMTQELPDRFGTALIVAGLPRERASYAAEQLARTLRKIAEELIGMEKAGQSLAIQASLAGSTADAWAQEAHKATNETVFRV
jgi:hypothetical protein